MKKDVKSATKAKNKSFLKIPVKLTTYRKSKRISEQSCTHLYD